MQNKKIKIPDKFYTLLGAGIILIGLLLGAYGIMYDVRFAFALGAGALFFGIFVSLLTGHMCAEDDGLSIKMPGKEKKLIPYDEIEWVYADLRLGSRGRNSNIRTLIYSIKIVTASENFLFETNGDIVPLSENLTDPKRREFLLMASPYRELEKIIKEKKGMYVESDAERILKLK